MSLPFVGSALLFVSREAFLVIGGPSSSSSSSSSSLERERTKEHVEEKKAFVVLRGERSVL